MKNKTNILLFPATVSILGRSGEAMFGKLDGKNYVRNDNKVKARMDTISMSVSTHALSDNHQVWYKFDLDKQLYH